MWKQKLCLLKRIAISIVDCTNLIKMLRNFNYLFQDEFVRDFDIDSEAQRNDELCDTDSCNYTLLSMSCVLSTALAPPFVNEKK